MKTLLIVVMMIFGAVKVSQAQEPAVVISDKAGWHKIGETKADFKTESEGITVLGKDSFKSIKLKITDAPINISKVTVYYENEKTEELSLNKILAPGTESKVFDLKNPTAEIKKVVFTYRSQPSVEGDKAHVELYGLK